MRSKRLLPNTIGASELITVWKEASFDPSLRAVYYVRVLEIPTPRWMAYDVKHFRAHAPGVPMITTERAYTSPIGTRRKANRHS